MNTTTTVLLNDEVERDFYKFRVTVSLIGSILSISGYSLLLATAALFPAWRKTKQNQLWLHMCGSYLVYFCLEFYTFVYPIEDPLAYGIVDHIKNYILRVSMCWMMVGAWLTYKNLVDVFCEVGDKFMLKASLLTWLLPLPFVALMYVLYVVEHPDAPAVKFLVGCNIFTENKNVFWALNCILDKFLIWIPIIGSLALYVRVTFSICKNRKVYGQERDLASTVALGFFFVFTCCVQCVVISAKYIFSLNGIWTYVTIVLQAFHVSTYSTLFLFCNKVTRQTWFRFIKVKLLGRIQISREP